MHMGIDETWHEKQAGHVDHPCVFARLDALGNIGDAPTDDEHVPRPAMGTVAIEDPCATQEGFIAQHLPPVLCLQSSVAMLEQPRGAASGGIGQLVR